jgi:hypothetical protein
MPVPHTSLPAAPHNTFPHQSAASQPTHHDSLNLPLTQLSRLPQTSRRFPKVLVIHRFRHHILARPLTTCTFISRRRLFLGLATPRLPATCLGGREAFGRGRWVGRVGGRGLELGEEGLEGFDYVVWRVWVRGWCVRSWRVSGVSWVGYRKPAQACRPVTR